MGACSSKKGTNMIKVLPFQKSDFSEAEERDKVCEWDDKEKRYRIQRKDSTLTSVTTISIAGSIASLAYNESTLDKNYEKIPNLFK